MHGQRSQSEIRMHDVWKIIWGLCDAAHLSLALQEPLHVVLAGYELVSTEYVSTGATPERVASVFCLFNTTIEATLMCLLPRQEPRPERLFLLQFLQSSTQGQSSNSTIGGSA